MSYVAKPGYFVTC